MPGSRGGGRGGRGTIDYRINDAFVPAPTGDGRAGDMGLGAMRAYLAGIDKMLGANDKLSNTYFRILNERQARDAQTSLSHEIRNKFMDMAKDKKYEGAGADKMVEDWEAGSKDLYDKWVEQNPDVNGNIARGVFQNLNEQYINRTAAIQMKRQAEYDTQSRVASVMETIDSEALSPLSVQAYKNVADKAKELFPNDLRMQQTLIDKGVKTLAGAGAQLSPGAFVKFAKGNKDLRSVLGTGHSDVMQRFEQGAESQMKADQHYAVAQQAQAKQQADWARVETQRNTMLGAVQQWADTGEWMAPNTPTKLADGSMGTLLEALGPNAGSYMKMFDRGTAAPAPVGEMRSNANSILNTLPADPKAALLNAQQLLSEGKIGDLELKQIQSQAAFWQESKAGKLQPLGSDRMMSAHDAIESRIDPKLTAQEQFDMQMRGMTVNESMKQQRTDAAIEIKMAIPEFIKAQRAAGLNDMEIDRQLSTNNSDSWLSQQIAIKLRSLGTSTTIPVTGDLDFSKGVR